MDARRAARSLNNEMHGARVLVMVSGFRQLVVYVKCNMGARYCMAPVVCV